MEHPRPRKRTPADVVALDGHVQLHLIAAERVVAFAAEAGVLQGAPVTGIAIVVEDDLSVELI